MITDSVWVMIALSLRESGLRTPKHLVCQQHMKDVRMPTEYNHMGEKDVSHPQAGGIASLNRQHTRLFTDSLQSHSTSQSHAYDANVSSPPASPTIHLLRTLPARRSKAGADMNLLSAVLMSREDVKNVPSSCSHTTETRFGSAWQLGPVRTMTRQYTVTQKLDVLIFSTAGERCSACATAIICRCQTPLC